MKKILIVMESALQTEQLVQQLSSLYHVVSCSDGNDGVEAVKEFNPDVLVLDLMLPGMDGVSLLEHSWNGGFRPKVIAMASYISDYIITKLERMNVSCLLRGPCETSQLVVRIMDVACGQEESIDGGRDTANILASLGFKINTSGCRITQLALECFARNPNQKVTTQLYPAVAAACNGTVTQVEKAIRDSIESAWKDRNEVVWRMYFDACKNGKLIKPSNGEFLARITRCIVDRARENIKERKIG